MSKYVRQLRILLASPSDLAPEREAVGRVVRELNRTFPSAVGIHLEVIAWESHSTPALGEDPQAILSEQLGDDYDLFIGILWARVGTPTPRAPSGTIEEFRRAYDRWKADPSAVSVMFYFKTQALSPLDLDPDQLAQVRAFRAYLQQSAVTADFSSTEHFEEHLRVHLTRQIFAAAGRTSKETRAAESQVVEAAPPDRQERWDEDQEDLDEGLLDLVDKSRRAFEIMNATIVRMGTETKALGNYFSQQVDKIRDLDFSRPHDAKRAKQLINRAAERIRTFVRRTEKELPILSDAAGEAFSSMGKAAQLAPDFGSEAACALEENLDAVRSLHPSVRDAREQIVVWRSTVEGMPRVTTSLNAAKQQMLAILQRVDEEFGRVQGLGQETEKMIDQVIRGLRAIR